MWRLTPIAECWQPPEDLDEIAGRLFRTGNAAPGFLRLLAKSHPALIAYVRAEEALANGMLTTAQREKIALAVAEINGSSYCLAAHEINGRKAGLTETEIRSARHASADDPKTRTLLHFVQALVLQRGEISDDDFSAMRKAGFSEAEIIESLANVTLNIFTNYFNLLARAELNYSPAPAGGKASQGAEI